MCVKVIASQMWDVFETRCTEVNMHLEFSSDSLTSVRDFFETCNKVRHFSHIIAVLRVKHNKHCLLLN